MKVGEFNYSHVDWISASQEQGAERKALDVKQQLPATPSPRMHKASHQPGFGSSVVHRVLPGRDNYSSNHNTNSFDIVEGKSRTN